MKKRHLVTAAAALAAAAFLTACSGGGEQAQAPAGGSEAAGTEAGGETAEVEEIVFAYMTQNNIPETVDLERIQNLINEYTEEKINTRVKLVLYSNADYMNQVNLMLAAGEQVDLFRTQDTSFIPYINDGTALDITEYLDDELKETTETIYNGPLPS